MHNLHFVLVEAENGEKACAKALSEIEDWGDSNNWRSACGAVNAEGVSFATGSGRWGSEEDLKLEAVQNAARNWLKDDGGHSKTTFFEVAKNALNGDTISVWDWYSAKTYASLMADRSWALDAHKITADEFDVFKHEYRGGKYDECGITHIDDMKSIEPGKKWCVLIDMHS